MPTQSLIDQLARWLAEFRPELQLLIMAAAFAAVWGILAWVTM